MILLSWTKSVLEIPALALNTLLEDGSYSNLLILFVTFLSSWWLYVPIHELMHVMGCILVGGEVNELALDPLYGGELLSKIFPFVVSDSDYAGQLTDFTTPNKFAYFVVDLFPYLLSLPGVLFIRLSIKFRYMWLFSIGFLLMYVPLTQMFGDFYEAASLGVGELMTLINPDLNPQLIISDDLFKLIKSLNENPTSSSFIYIFVILSFVLGLILAWLVMIIQVPLANIFQVDVPQGE